MTAYFFDAAIYLFLPAMILATASATLSALAPSTRVDARCAEADEQNDFIRCRGAGNRYLDAVHGIVVPGIVGAAKHQIDGTSRCSDLGVAWNQRGAGPEAGT